MKIVIVAKKYHEYYRYIYDICTEEIITILQRRRGSHLQYFNVILYYGRYKLIWLFSITLRCNRFLFLFFNLLYTYNHNVDTIHCLKRKF